MGAVMRRLLVGIVLIVCASTVARAATMREVNALLDQANAALKSSGGDRATALGEAIEHCKRALELLGEVKGLSAEQRDKKSSDILSTLYWCKKMMPLENVLPVLKMRNIFTLTSILLFR